MQIFNSCPRDGEPIKRCSPSSNFIENNEAVGRYVIDNAYNFLEGKEDLYCTMYDGLKALETMETWVNEIEKYEYKFQDIYIFRFNISI